MKIMDIEKLIKSISFPVMNSENESIMGTCFLLNKAGMAITCKHVIDNCTTPLVNGHNITKTRLYDCDYPYDIFLFKMKDFESDISDIVVPEIGLTTELNDNVIYHGFGDLSQTEGRPVQGKLKQRYGNFEYKGIKIPTFKFSTIDHDIIHLGDSGSAMLNTRTSKICGIINFELKKINIGNGINFNDIIRGCPEVSKMLEFPEISPIENIHVTSICYNKVALESLFEPFLRTHHDYNVTFTSITEIPDLPIANKDILNETDLHIIIIGKSSNFELNENQLNCLQEEHNTCRNNKIPLLVFENFDLEISYSKRTPYIKKLNEIFPDRNIKNMMIKIFGRAKNTLNDHSKCKLNFILDELKNFLSIDIASFIEDMGFIDSTSYLRDILDPILPEKRNSLYINGFKTEINVLNTNLRESVRDLYLCRHGISPISVKEYLKCSSKNLSYFVDKILCPKILELGLKEKEFIFTDYTIGSGVEKIWVNRAIFRKILLSTIDVFLQLKDEEFKKKFKFKRIFIFDFRDQFELSDFFDNDPSIKNIILLQLAMNIELHFYLAKNFNENFFEADRNFFLIKDEVVGIIDVRFPYIRVYKYAQLEKRSGLNSSELIHDAYSNFLATTVSKLLESNKLNVNDFEQSLTELRNVHLIDNRNFKKKSFKGSNKQTVNCKDLSGLRAFQKILKNIDNDEDEPENISLLHDFLNSIKYTAVKDKIESDIIGILL